MRIGDAAAAAGTTARALRFYEANGLLPAPQRTVTGQRVYGHREVARLRVIRGLLSLGLTVSDLRECADRLDLLDGDAAAARGAGRANPAGRAHPAGPTARRIATLDAEISRLTGLRDDLKARTRIQANSARPQ
ncbi:MerR family transcriptional regulator [Actinoplanes awajinensis]|uniref:MerR family transcriptional regulator n=1 Tax=Actinoplanes awajinensis subsp. mycoplanecinus TaxID=135947 RepID=A0A0X3V6S7_9ACTN|nr:MerR family transcriptional regulator [Actinoplanes awajinensis]KUL40503.1 MerR family transcriptional regulator [Actinoplanes awajinensis subsp. mycoplanecinus]